MPLKRLTRRDFLKFSGLAALNVFLAGAAGLGYGTLLEPERLDVEQVPLKLPRLSPVFTGFRIAQISDIHMGGWMNRERLAYVVQNVIAQAPDLVVITGDFVIGHDWYGNVDVALSDLMEELKMLTTQHLTLAVLGNHDHWLDAAAVRAMLTKCGIREIGNDVHTLERKDAQLHLAGVDDRYVYKDRLDIVLEKLPEDGAAILLAHEPDFASQSAATGRFDLQLSGHTHGGQVVLPLWGPPILPHLGLQYPSGLYRVDGMWQYTNRGVGMSKPYVRINCRPEITVFTLESA